MFQMIYFPVLSITVATLKIQICQWGGTSTKRSIFCTLFMPKLYILVKAHNTTLKVQKCISALALATVL